MDTTQGYANFAAFPPTGTPNIIYIDLSNGDRYRWVTSAYVSIQQTKTNVSIGYKDQAWFDANPTYILEYGQHVYLLGGTGEFVIGDGITELQNLPLFGLPGAFIPQSGTVTPISGPLEFSASIDPALFSNDGTDESTVRLNGNQFYVFAKNLANPTIKSTINVDPQSINLISNNGTNGVGILLDTTQARVYINALNGLTGNVYAPTQPEDYIQKDYADNTYLDQDTLGFNVKKYGLLGDGTTNDSAALNTLLNTTAPSGSTIYFPPGIYLINTAVVVLDKQFNFIGNHANIRANSNGRICDISSSAALASKWKFTNLNFSGTGIGAGGNQYAFYFSSKAGGFSFTNCTFSDFGGGGVAVAATDASASIGGLFNGCKFYNNVIGIDASFTRAEYIQVIGCDFFTNTTAIKCNSGNLLVDGCNITYNGTGISLINGANDSHGIISNNNINHNTAFGLDISGVLNGMTISNNHFYENKFSIINSTGITFLGGQIDIVSFTFTNNISLIFNNVRFGNSYGGTVSLTGAVPFYNNCVSMGGLIATAPATYISAGTPPNSTYSAIGGANIGLSDTFDGLTLQQIIRLIKNKGLLNYQ